MTSHPLRAHLATAVLILAFVLPAAAPAAAGDVKPIQDNSFLLEEAYNQEPGVIQHISAFMRARDGSWLYTFTQEWPAPGLRHQLSYTVPVAGVPCEGGRETGFGDIALNYRLQALGSGETRVAFSPRLSAIAPTGNARRGLGTGGWGLQLNLPLSVVVTEKLVSHTNVGMTRTWDARDASGPLDAFNLGQSVIWLAGQRVNLMLEAYWLRFQEADEPLSPAWGTQFLISPGIRYAIDFKSGLQIVPGIAFPIGVGPSSGERSVFLYLSFEHPLWKAAP
jgi:hypothetical protein